LAQYCDGCGKSLADAVRVEGVRLLCEDCLEKDADPLYLSISYDNVSSSTISQSDAERRSRIFYIKAVTGVAVALARDQRLRWWTFTESDLGIMSEKDVWFEFRLARQMIRRHYGEEVQMIIVEHRQGKFHDWIGELRHGDCQRHNYHVIEAGKVKLDVMELEAYWQEHYSSKVTGMEEIVNPEKAVSYLCGYVTDAEKFIKARFTHNWVFPGWWEYTKYWRKSLSVDGSYPETGDIVRMALMSGIERSSEPEFQDFELATIVDPDKRAKLFERILIGMGVEGHELESTVAEYLDAFKRGREYELPKTAWNYDRDYKLLLKDRDEKRNGGVTDG